MTEKQLRDRLQSARSVLKRPYYTIMLGAKFDRASGHLVSRCGNFRLVYNPQDNSVKLIGPSEDVNGL